MSRSTGITVSGIVILTGSAFTLFMGAMMVLASVILMKSSSAANVRAISGVVMVVEAVMFFGFGGWGVASGIGLLKRKQWARISTLVYAGILVFFSLPPAIIFAVFPMPHPNDPNLPSYFMTAMRVGMVLFYVALAALGGFWLYFFNRQHVKEQFRGIPPGVESAAQDSLPGTPVPARSPRPLSITIIGWFLLVSAALGPLYLPFYDRFFPGVQLPLCFLGFFFFGRSAKLIFIAWAAAQMAAAVGLLKLKNWGLFGTIGLQCLAVLNVVLLAGIPANRAKFQQLMETMVASMNTRMAQPVPYTIPMWTGIAGSLPLVFVVLWFLITRRRAFGSAGAEAARQDS